ncbi:hypothetical protein BASA83_008607 [Batrachochytrium salamandrivorans]|nr:hypothetical protein BASA83_008607 [Batrachochytrium salamandrivorans]
MDIVLWFIKASFDFRDGPMGSSEWIESLEWHGTKGFLAAPRDIWRTSITLNDSTPHVAGYITKHQSLVRVELLGAGHVAPMDQGIGIQTLGLRPLGLDMDIDEETQSSLGDGDLGFFSSADGLAEIGDATDICYSAPPASSSSSSAVTALPVGTGGMELVWIH